MVVVKLEVLWLLRYKSRYRKTWTFNLTRASHLLHQYVFAYILYRCMFVNAYPFDLHFWIYPLRWKLPKSYIYFLCDSVYVYYCMLMKCNGKSILSFKDCEWPSVAQKPKYVVVHSVRFPVSSSVYRLNSSEFSKKYTALGTFLWFGVIFLFFLIALSYLIYLYIMSVMVKRSKDKMYVFRYAQ